MYDTGRLKWSQLWIVLLISIKKVFRYILLYKPYNVLCQFSASNDRLTLKNYLDVPEVYPVGRLDQDSEGMVLLTNNGLLQDRLAHPRYAHPRTYWVQVEGIPQPNALQALRTGLDLKDYRTRPAKVTLLEGEPSLPERDPPIRYRKTVPTTWLEMTLTEGKNRQVRHMTAKVGYPTLRLVRVSIGSPTHQLTLEGLTPGQWRDLSPKEVRNLEVLGKRNFR